MAGPARDVQMRFVKIISVVELFVKDLNFGRFLNLPGAMFVYRMMKIIRKDNIAARNYCIRWIMTMVGMSYGFYDEKNVMHVDAANAVLRFLDEMDTDWCDVLEMNMAEMLPELFTLKDLLKMGEKEAEYAGRLARFYLSSSDKCVGISKQWIPAANLLLVYNECARFKGGKIMCDVLKQKLAAWLERSTFAHLKSLSLETKFDTVCQELSTMMDSERDMREAMSRL